MDTTSTITFEYGVAAELDATQLLTEQDQACFDEIQQILKKHQALNRFGVTLLDDEVLPQDSIRLETNSTIERTLITRIVDNNQLKNKSIETNWTLSNSKVIAACLQSCEVSRRGKHGKDHASSGNGPSPNNQ